MKQRTILYAAAALGFAACGDNADPSNADAPPGPTADAPDEPDPDAEVPPADAAPFVAPTPFGIPVSATGPDQMQAAAPAPDGAFYIAGFAAQTPTGARNLLLIKTTTTGPDPEFGTGGLAFTTVEFRGGNDEIDLAVQPSGAILLSATIADETVAADRDIAILRFTAEGDLDPTFGDDGIARVDLNAAIDNGSGTLVGADAARSLAVDATGRIYLHAAQRGEVPAGRTDTDFSVTRLTVDGELDDTFGDGGTFVLDLTGGTPAASLSATPRRVFVLANGNVLGTGYTSNPSFGAGPQPVLFELDPDGELVDGFAEGGVFHDIVLAVQTEVYGGAIHGNSIVTGGYGREAGDQNDWVSMKFDLTTGARDTNFGGAPNGAVTIDPSGTMVGDNCRGAYALPDGRTLLIGSTGPGNMPAQDAVFAVLAADGTLDPAFGDGVHQYAFGAGEGGADQLWGAAVSGDHAIIVGYAGAGMTQTETLNDNSWGVLLPLP
jgi:uncharacterized delta-60 repeat protein